jgi:hypothetical protein
MSLPTNSPTHNPVPNSLVVTTPEGEVDIDATMLLTRQKGAEIVESIQKFQEAAGDAKQELKKIEQAVKEWNRGRFLRLLFKALEIVAYMGLGALIYRQIYVVKRYRT